MKTMLLIVTLFYIPFSMASTNILLACNDCSENQRQGLVYSQRVNQDLTAFYVVDFNRGSFGSYFLVDDQELGIKYVRPFTASSEIQDVVSDYFSAKQDLIDNFDSTLLSQIISSELSSTSTTSNSNITIKANYLDSSSASGLSSSGDTDLMELRI